jgi:hypothetical protein
MPNPNDRPRNDRPRNDQPRGGRDDSKMKIAYSITERGGKSFWNRIGVAFTNSDGSLNVKLECLPVNGEIHIRDYVPSEERGGNRD